MIQLRPEDWRFVDDVMSVHDRNPQTPDEVFDAFLAAAFRGEIPWEKDADGKATQWGKVARLRPSGVSHLLRAMAQEANTAEELRGLFQAMDCAAGNNMRGATGAAGDVLLDRAAARPGTAPLPAGWRAVAEAELVRGAGHSGAYWALHMMNAADRRGPHTGMPDMGVA